MNDHKDMSDKDKNTDDSKILKFNQASSEPGNNAIINDLLTGITDEELDTTDYPDDVVFTLNPAKPLSSAEKEMLRKL